MKSLQLNNVILTWLGHASFRLEHSTTSVYIDPYNVLDGKKADIILITHGHYDHCSIPDIMRLVKPDTEIVITPDSTSKLSHKVTQGNTRLVKPGDAFSIKDVKVEAVPAYNLEKQFHPKDNQWVGYIVTVNGVRFYHAGDSDAIPEMSRIRADVVLLPIGGTYTMNAEEAAGVVNVMKPKLAIPMHYGSIVGSLDDAKRFKELCRCEVRLL